MTRSITGFLRTLAVCGSFIATADAATTTYTLLETVDHGPSLFTQGLIVDGDTLIESSGGYKKSRIVRYDADTGKITQSTALPPSIFAEGLEHYNGSLYLLTWREGKAFRLDPTDFSIQQEFKLENEGWGLTHNGEHFIQSDGSDTLYFRNSTTFKVEKKISVYEGGNRRFLLNELEYAHGLIWANVFMTPTILAISPSNGQVLFSLNLSPIAARHRTSDSNKVLNGIAYDPKRDAFWVTGKCWSKRYLIKVDLPETPKPEK